MSDRYLNIDILNELDLFPLSSNKYLIDNITGTLLNSNKFELNPYQVVWVSLTE